MQPRYRMTTRRKDSFIETLNRGDLEVLRKTLPSIFRRSRIKHIIQAYPSKVPLGELIDYTWR